MPSLDKDTFTGALAVLLKNIGEMKQLPDALSEMPWVIQLETFVLDKVHSPERKMQQAGLIPGGGQNPQGNAALGLPSPGGGAPGGAPGGMSAPPPSFMGAGAPPGVQMSPAGPQGPGDMSQFGM